MPLKVNDILHERLRNHNLSKVSRDLGISKSLLSDWVNCRRVPNLRNVDALLKLAKYLGLSLEALLVGDQAGASEPEKIMPSLRRVA